MTGMREVTAPSLRPPRGNLSAQINVTVRRRPAGERARRARDGPPTRDQHNPGCRTAR